MQCSSLAWRLSSQVAATAGTPHFSLLRDCSSFPFAAFAWVRRRRGLATAAIVAGGLVDIAIAVATVREGFEYVERIFATVPLLVVFWAALWICWQIGLIVAFFGGTLRGRSNT